tara:strand:+ start:189 stop:356 length:168 start_codon:yes stop_codon:yes gene_type:complete
LKKERNPASVKSDKSKNMNIDYRKRNTTGDHLQINLQIPLSSTMRLVPCPVLAIP